MDGARIYREKRVLRCARCWRLAVVVLLQFLSLHAKSRFPSGMTAKKSNDKSKGEKQIPF